MKLLVTGFEPFGGSSVNASWEAVRQLPYRLAGAEILTLELSTAFEACFAEVEAAIEREKPDVVLCVGEAGGRTGLTPERVALNWDDARIADNHGYQPTDKPIIADAPTAYLSQMPVKDLVSAIVAAGVPASVSYSAGTFVCNHLMFRLEHHRSTSVPQLLTGFLHVPTVDAMETATAVKGLVAALRILAG
ncbi:MAG: pyroglutamyl-peptidase I [Spirochaetales bacterium]